MSGGYVITPAPKYKQPSVNLVLSRFTWLKGGIYLLDVLIDEFTLVLKPSKRPLHFEDWEIMAVEIIEEFVSLTNIETIFGQLEDHSHTLPQGYSMGFSCQNLEHYFAMAYHPDYLQMGICIKFSASAWLEYKNNFYEQFNKHIHIHDFLLTSSNTNAYSLRLSRVDIAIDFIDEKVSVNTLYNQLSKKNHIVKNDSGRNNHSTLSAITKDNITSTFYLGSKGKNIKALLRVYDKKKEQLETMGIRYHDAINYDSWVRFEAVFKGKYAHRLTEKFLEIKSDTELKDTLVSALTDRYIFYYAKSGRITTHSKKMLQLLNQKNFKFSSPSPRLNLLEQSQKHILNGSGLFSYLYKVKKIWGDDGLNDCLDFLQNEFDHYEPTEDVLLWLKKYTVLYTKQGYPF